jgi:hypothetical protein
MNIKSNRKLNNFSIINVYKHMLIVTKSPLRLQLMGLYMVTLG